MRGERGELSLVGWGVVLVVVGVLVAIPYTLLGRHEADTAEQGIQAIGQANDVSAEASLTNALQGAKVWLAEQGSLVGYGVTQATDFDPQTKYDASATAEAGVVSIRGADADEHRAGDQGWHGGPVRGPHRRRGDLRPRRRGLRNAVRRHRLVAAPGLRRVPRCSRPRVRWSP